MSVTLNPYLGFQGNARAAMEFYQGVFGGKLDVSTFKEMHASQTPSDDDLVMHSMLVADNGMTLMGSDTPSSMEFRPGTNFSVSLSGDDEAALSGYYDKLSDGGTVGMPLQKAVWGDTFGMWTDKFGINWVVNIAGQPAG